MPTISTTPVSATSFPTTSARTVGGVTSIDLDFASAMSKGSGTIIVTDGAVQTVIDRVTGEPRLRVVGGTFSKQITLDKVAIDGTHVKFDAAGLPPGAGINVYMAAGTLLSGGKAAGAITVPGSAAFTMPAADPSLTASIALDGASLKSGEEIAVTITFSKAVASLSPASLAAGNAGIRDLASTDGGKTWTATLSGLDAVNAPSNVLRLNMDTVVAADGSRGAGKVDSSVYMVDTLVAAYVDDAIQMFDDNGPDDMDGITNGDAIGLGGLLRGDLKAGESFELVINGTVIDPAKIEMYAAYEPGTHYWYYTGADDEHFAPGENTVLVRVIGPDGHSSQTVRKTILVEQDTPGIVSQPGGTIDASQSISIGFDEAMYLDDDVETVQKIELVDGFGNTSWIVLDDSMLSADRKTLSIDPASHKLATGNDYDLYLPFGLTDLAGNGYEGPAISFRTDGAFQDKAPPRLVQLYIVNGSGSYKAGDVLEFRLRYTEKVTLDAGAEPVLYLDGGMTADYFGLANGGTEMVFKYTVKPGDNEESLDADHSWTLYGHVRDDHGNVFQNAHVEYEGLSDADGYGAMVSVDTTAPGAPGLPLLAPGSNSGSKADLLTNDRTPTLSGSADAYARVELYEGDSLLGYAYADDVGAWSVTVEPGKALGDGTHQLTVKQFDQAGNGSTGSLPLALTIDGSAPNPPNTPVLAPTSDSGVLNDGTTNVRTPTLRGTADPGTTVVLYVDGSEIARTATDGNGNWEYAIPLANALTDGLHGIQLAQIDGAGNQSGRSDAFDLTIDTSAAVLGRPALAAGSDSGSSSSDGITNDTTPTFSGSGADAGATVVLYAGAREIGRQTADGSGNWTLTVLDADKFTVDGSYAITARQTDKAGNTSDASSAFTLVIDTVGPSVVGFESRAAQREFQLGFSEQIVFRPNGMFKLINGMSELLNFTGNSHGNWYTTDSAAGADSVLNFRISMTGLYNLQMNNESVQDLAGNVAIIGSPQWLVELPAIAS